jgi:Fic family protein
MLEKIYKIHKLEKLSLRRELQEYSLADQKSPLGEAVDQAQDAYLSWDEFRKKSWSPDIAEKAWGIVSRLRQFLFHELSIVDKDGHSYSYQSYRHEQFRHEIDMELGGNMLGFSDFSEKDKRQIIRRNLIEESIASSKLEGANTSRETARRMLAEGRQPNDKSERMIFNNHVAMTWIEEKGKFQKLSLDALFDLHRMVTERTQENEEQAGKLRETLNANGKRLVIKPWDDETITYVAPDREFVEMELPKLIAFANDEDGSPFIHPLNKAIMLHFWIGLLHPFEDGNGRLARILFYWYMLRKRYWAFSYLSLSERISKSPKQYAMAFINSEQDNYDLNYFIQYNVEKLQLARQQLLSYLKIKIAENRQRLKLAQGDHGLNERQIKLLQNLHMEEFPSTSVAEYQIQQADIGYVTAVSDLKTLVTREFLKKQRSGRNILYLPTSKVETLFR